jgi:SAM-dependent methyltransferase
MMTPGAPMLTDLDEQQAFLAQVSDTDFRASSLNTLVSRYLVPGSVLDVGCGGGGMVAWLLKNGYDASGIDSSSAVVDTARGLLAARGCDVSRVKVARIEELVSNGVRVDNVLSMDCLEHQEDDRSMFSSLLGVLRPGGRLLVTVPAVPGLFSERDRTYGHYRRYTRERLLDLCRSEPLRVDDLRYWNLLGVPPTFLYARVLRRAIHEDFRYGRPSFAARVLRRALSLWFSGVENSVRPPIGLTLLLAATRLDDRGP